MILDYAHKVPSLMVFVLTRVTLRFKYRVTVARGGRLPPCTYRGRMNTARGHAVRGEFLRCRSTCNSRQIAAFISKRPTFHQTRFKRGLF